MGFFVESKVGAQRDVVGQNAKRRENAELQHDAYNFVGLAHLLHGSLRHRPGPAPPDCRMKYRMSLIRNA